MSFTMNDIRTVEIGKGNYLKGLNIAVNHFDKLERHSYKPGVFVHFVVVIRVNR